MYRRFIGMNQTMFEYDLAQGVTQRLELRITGGNPFREGRAGDE